MQWQSSLHAVASAVLWLQLARLLASACNIACGMQVTATNVDIATVAPSYHLYNQSEVEEVISRL